MKRIVLFIITLLVLTAVNAQAATYYVATTGNDANPGTQAQPFKTIQKGIDTAASGDTILVLSGTYFQHLHWENKSLTLMGSGSGQKIIDGGGTGTCLALYGVPGSARIEGFTLQNGNPEPPSVGGGMYLSNSSLTVSHCLFQNNQAGEGGGMFNDAGSFPTVTGCTFQNNSVPYSGGLPGGGAMWNGNHSGAYVTNCVFTGNSDASPGLLSTGGMANIGGSPTVTNCIFAFNGGNAMTNTSNARPTVTNCTFYGNGGYANFNFNGGGDYNTGVWVSNCIVWGNGGGIADDVPANDSQVRSSVVFHSDVQGGINGGPHDGGGNINADPRFVGGGNYRLQSNSPCLNTGSADVPNLPATDLEDRPRILGPAPDMGAYEFWAAAYGQWFVDRATGNDANAGSPLSPFKTVVKAINTASNGHKIYIKQGNYGTDTGRIVKGVRLVNWNNTGLSRVGQP